MVWEIEGGLEAGHDGALKSTKDDLQDLKMILPPTGILHAR